LKLITWNIQCGRGCDGVVSLQRIVETARALADFDVLCLQEVASNFTDLDGSSGEDEPAMLAELLPEYLPVMAAATDLLAANGSRRLFGNMIFSRLPVLQVFRHSLPWPADPETASMPRILIECVMQAPWGPLRVMTTHLEYYSLRQRTAQVERIRELHNEAVSRANTRLGHGHATGPFREPARTASTILTGDFNFRPEDPLHAQLMTPLVHSGAPLHDVWQALYPLIPHAPTVGVHDRAQWPEGAFCCDFVYVTGNLVLRLETMHVDQNSIASDHQPLLVSLTDRG